MIELPERVLRTAQSKGAEGRRWLDRLPEDVAHLCATWSLSLGEVLDGGSLAFVARVRADDGTDAVLKVSPPGPDVAAQAGTLAAADGHGYARLYAHDLDRGAMLLEPLGGALARAGLPVERVLDVSAAVLTQAWRTPRAEGMAVAPGADKASGLIELITGLWVELDRPCSAALVEQALVYARRRAAAFDPDRSVVCHGDPHPDNVLAVPSPRAGAESGYVLVDPDGFLDDPAYDLGVVVREWNAEVLSAPDPRGLLRGYCARLAAATGIEAQRIWEWGFVERVSSGLYLMRHGHDECGREFLASGERLLL
ncbi:aminoglycoside phosphotransferase family protein [Catellatospora sp. KI3]|uniref:aminoglycoside phosphotransferase family protein n=1 Tax=Catellatospora sp. KI3 TaxID=3041620 RepID=UPI0024828AE4|nr:aminoglycoside phosphotransferase family protein [Catellatospora sp. KI3]MDI1465839.1 aminoglycoside phosphotransferase family protein [Catellatospora sp. KI3]